VPPTGGGTKFFHAELLGTIAAVLTIPQLGAVTSKRDSVAAVPDEKTTGADLVPFVDLNTLAITAVPATTAKAMIAIEPILPGLNAFFLVGTGTSPMTAPPLGAASSFKRGKAD
jgi:hypothetical protein